MSVTAQLCDRIVDSTPAAIPQAARQAANTLLLDGLAVAVAGARSERSVRLLADHLLAQGSRPMASVIGMGATLATVPAALINGAAMHALDFEPMWKPSNHALSTTLPAALALAEANGNSGLDLVCALIKGIEIQGWIRQACGKVEARDLVFHQPGMVGPFGSAVAASHLLGLDARQLAHALGIAASRCGGLIANIGTMTKATHCGYAAALGLEAALLAQRGLTANPNVFEAKQGYVAAFLPTTFDPAKLLGFGPPFRVVQPGFALKAFPCKYQTHYTIVCALAVLEQIADARDIQEIRLRTPEFPAANRPQPASGLEGMFSLQFTFAAALLDGAVSTRTFTDARLHDPALQSLLGKTSLQMDPTLSSEFEGRLVEARVRMKDGREIHTTCARPPGSWGAPPIPAGQYRQKLEDCLGALLATAAIDRCMALTGRADELDAAGVRELIHLCRGEDRPRQQPAL